MQRFLGSACCSVNDKRPNKNASVRRGCNRVAFTDVVQLRANGGSFDFMGSRQSRWPARLGEIVSCKIRRYLNGSSSAGTERLRIQRGRKRRLCLPEARSWPPARSSTVVKLIIQHRGTTLAPGPRLYGKFWIEMYIPRSRDRGRRDRE
jgi:hypothetical protein